MITVEEALKIVRETALPSTKTEMRSVAAAAGYVLTEDLVSPIDMPPFRQSAMDGYALHLGDSNQYSIVGEIKAGDPDNPVLIKGEAVRIFTGAAVPDSCNAIAIQERVTVKNNHIMLQSEVNPTQNIRSKGEQVGKGQVALEKGTPLTPAAIGYLTSLGLTKLNVYKKPSIAIISTGNELVPAGNQLNYGQIYESNTLMLKTALNSRGYLDSSVFKVSDTLLETVSCIKNALERHDILLITGGISVGDFDYVGRALKELNVTELFYRVKQKPGKPLFFGQKNEKLLFALPGNPAAALSCFYIYVLTALEIMSGNTGFSLPRLKVRSATSFENKTGRAQFLKASYHHGKVNILDGQSSSMLHSFSIANALAYVPEDKTTVAAGEEIEVILLPVN